MPAQTQEKEEKERCPDQGHQNAELELSPGEQHAHSHIGGEGQDGAAKGAVFGYTNVVARELVGTGVTMNGVVPSATRTRQVMEAVERARELPDDDERDLGRLADGLLAVIQEPEDVAVVIAALVSDRAGDINGQVLLARGDEVGIFPRLEVSEIQRRDDGWTIDALVEALPTFTLNPMTDPYRNG